MAIDESTLSKGQLRKLTVLRRYVGDELGEEAFGKWMAQQAAASASKVDPVAQKIDQALAGFADDRSFRLGVYSYTIRRARSKGATGLVATKKTETVSDLLWSDFENPRRDDAGDGDEDIQRLEEMLEAVADDSVLPIEP